MIHIDVKGGSWMRLFRTRCDDMGNWMLIDLNEKWEITPFGRVYRYCIVDDYGNAVSRSCESMV